MPFRHYFWTLVLLILSCSTFFHRRSEFEKGLAEYQAEYFQKAAKHFGTYYAEHIGSQTTLYYLYDCHKRLDQTTEAIHVLKRLVKIGSTDENVHLNLFQYYRTNKQYNDLSTLLNNLQPPIISIFNEKCALTRRLYAEIISGATDRLVYADPMVFAVSEKYLPLFPDSKFYDNDTLTNRNLIVLLDKLVEPIYPERLYTMKSVQSNSFIYLPYMRLVHLGIMDFNADLDPDAKAPVISAAKGIARLKDRGLID